MEKNKSFFSESEISNIILLEKKKGLITDSCILANLCNNYFINIKSTFKLNQSPKFSLIPNLLIHYRDQMSIIKRKETYKIAELNCLNT